jgi:hypothetical protein
MNYMRAFDELGAGLSKVLENELGQSYDMRRVFATVVIGHSAHVSQTNDRSVIAQTLRSYNAHLSRIEVVTYDQLAESAERALAFEEDAKAQRSSLRGSPVIDDEDEDPWEACGGVGVDLWDDEPPF